MTRVARIPVDIVGSERQCVSEGSIKGRAGGASSACQKQRTTSTKRSDLISWGEYNRVKARGGGSRERDKEKREKDKEERREERNDTRGAGEERAEKEFICTSCRIRLRVCVNVHNDQVSIVFV